MALAGAFKLCSDEPGNVVVVIFPDNAFKYASSVVKHLSGLGTAPVASKSKREKLLDAMIENARFNADLAIDVDAAHDLWQSREPFLVDVRGSNEDQAQLVVGAVNIPLLELPEQVAKLPEDRNAPILAFCQRGNLSLSGALFLNSLGYRNARSVTGGTKAWRERGFATMAT